MLAVFFGQVVVVSEVGLLIKSKKVLSQIGGGVGRGGGDYRQFYYFC